MEYQLFMCAIEKQWHQLLEEELLKYKGRVGNYVISHEVADDGSHEETKGSHFHFLVQMSESDYHTYAKRIFIDKFKLRGRALKNLPRQYGKMKKVYDSEKALSYVVKDMNDKKDNIRTNMKVEDIELAFQKSFKKEDKPKTLYDDLMKHLKSVTEDNKQSGYDLSLEIISYYRLNKAKKRLSRSTLTGLVSDYMMYYDSRYTSQDVYNFLY